MRVWSGDLILFVHVFVLEGYFVVGLLTFQTHQIPKYSPRFNMSISVSENAVHHHDDNMTQALGCLPKQPLKRPRYTHITIGNNKFPRSDFAGMLALLTTSHSAKFRPRIVDAAQFRSSIHGLKDQGNVRAIIDGMVEFRGNAKVQKEVCRALREVARKSKGGYVVAAYGGIAGVLDAMVLHPTAAGVQEEANLSDCYSESIKAAGGQQHIHNALAQDNVTNDTRKWGSKLLAQLDCSYSDDDDYIRCARCNKMAHVDELDEATSTVCAAGEGCREDESDEE